MNSAVEDIKSRINIVDLIGEYIRVQKAGSSWKGLCPFHHEKSPSFMVSEEKQMWHCFRPFQWQAEQPPPHSQRKPEERLQMQPL